MAMTRSILLGGLVAVALLSGMGFAGVAHAQYLGNVGSAGETGQYTLEEALELQSRRVTVAAENPQAGSGTPYLDANGVVGASIISGAIFGGIAAAFFMRSRSGKYAAMGRG